MEKLVMVPFKGPVRRPMKFATTLFVKAHIITFIRTKLLPLIIIINIISFCYFTTQSITFFVVSFHLGCNVNGTIGTGKDQGTCPKANEVCNADGTCGGAYNYIN